MNLQTRLKDVNCGPESRFKVDAYLDSGAIENSISESIFVRLSKAGAATRLDTKRAVKMISVGGGKLKVLGETKVSVWWFGQPRGERRDERFRFQVIRGLYPHMIFKERTLRDLELREDADTWPTDDPEKGFSMFRRPWKSAEKRQQDAAAHEMKRLLNMEKALQEERERARQRGDEKKPRNSLEATISSTSRHSRR